MSERNKGIICIILSAFFFAVMNTCIKLSGDLPIWEKCFFRNCIAFVVSAGMLIHSKTWFSGRKGNLSILFFRSLGGMLGLFCNFYSIDHMLVADSSMLNKLSPFFVVLFSALLLKERVKPYQMVCLIGAFLGALFVIKPTMSSAMLPALIASLGGVSAGFAYTLVRMLGERGEKGSFIVFFFSGFCTIITLPLMILTWKPMSWMQLLILLCAGLAATGGQIFITTAYKYAPGRDISIYDYSQIIFITILSFFLLGEMPDAYSVIGYIVIIGASIAMFLISRRKDRTPV